MKKETIVNLLRCVADIIEDTTEEQTKPIEEVEKSNKNLPIKNTNAEHIIDLMKRVDETSKIQAYKSKLQLGDVKLKSALSEIDKLREEAIKNFMENENVPEIDKEIVGELVKK